MHKSAVAFYRIVALAKVAMIIPVIPDPQSSPVKGELLSLVLPSIYILALISVLDEALDDYIEDNALNWPPKTKRDLHNRIELVSRHLPTIDGSALHKARRVRNEVAHEVDGLVGGKFSWDEVEECIDAISGAFTAMKVHSEMPEVSSFYERTPTLFLDEPGPNNERMIHRFVVGAKLNAENFLEYENQVSYMALS